MLLKTDRNYRICWLNNVNWHRNYWENFSWLRRTSIFCKVSESDCCHNTDRSKADGRNSPATTISSPRSTNRNERRPTYWGRRCRKKTSSSIGYGSMNSCAWRTTYTCKWVCRPNRWGNSLTRRCRPTCRTMKSSSSSRKPTKRWANASGRSRSGSNR